MLANFFWKNIMVINPKNLYIGWIPRNFKIFIFEPKLSFSRKNHKNYSWGEFQDFHEFTLYKIIEILLKMAIQILAIYAQN